LSEDLVCLDSPPAVVSKTPHFTFNGAHSSSKIFGASSSFKQPSRATQLSQVSSQNVSSCSSYSSSRSSDSDSSSNKHLFSIIKPFKIDYEVLIAKVGFGFS